MLTTRATVLLLLATPFATALPAQGAPVDPAGRPGTRILGGGGKLPDAIYARFVELAGGAKAHIVLLPGASARADDEKEREASLAHWQQDHPGVHFEVFHTRDRAQADDEVFTAPLRAATGIWIGGGVQKRLADAYLGTRVERELQAVLARGGVVGGSSAGTAIQTRTMIQEGMDPPVVAQGFDFVPFAVSDQHFLKRNRLPRLVQVLTTHPGLFGIGVDEGTAVEIHGRELTVLGASKALLVLAATVGREQRVVELAAGKKADLITWQRAARDRAAPPWPPVPMAEPRVANGSLVIVGGGRLPAAVTQRFLDLAGGAAAKVVIVPSANPSSGTRPENPFAAQLRQRGVTDIRVFDCSHPSEVTPDKLAVLTNATAIWFGGGRQWRLCDAFDGTPAVAAFHAVLARGGVIGGSSAGATIQGDFLVRGNPLGNTDMWCEGYDRGFGFLPGCAIDQHFIARNRKADLQGVISKLPQLIGLGIDEGTAAIVRGSELEVLGASQIAVFDARPREGSPAAAGAPEPTWLEPGARWDLARGLKL
ncbi:MAG: cyanophycinase [Planctomycetota bacterium]